jgi:hypothetical protein
MPESSDTEASLRGRLAAFESWAKTDNRSARTAPGRAALLAKFEKQVDPDGTLPPAERARRAEYVRRAHFTRLSLKSAKVRRQRATQRAAQRAAERDAPEDRIAHLEALAGGAEAAS